MRTFDTKSSVTTVGHEVGARHDGDAGNRHQGGRRTALNRISAMAILLALIGTLGLVQPAHAATKTEASLIVSPIAPKNRTIPFSGHVKVTGSPKTKSVKLQIKKGKAWRTVSTKKLNSKANYTFKSKMTKTGTFTYRVRVYSGKKLLATSTTRAMKVSPRVTPPKRAKGASAKAATSKAKAMRDSSATAAGTYLGQFSCNDYDNSAQINHPWVTTSSNLVSWWYAELWIDRTAGAEPYFPWSAGRLFFYDPATYVWFDYLTYAPSGGVVWSSNLPGQYLGYNYIWVATGPGTYDSYAGFSPGTCSMYD